ncbi:MAG: DUF4417 domain-containing protein [Lachnospiraceae bacterium]|nr:DUF4417 domain-containing protein [Lachnospiraceae bacterium]
MERKEINNFIKNRSGCRDVWNSFMCDGASFTDNDIPICPTILTSIPKELITFTEAKQLHNNLSKLNKEYFYNAFVCFYIDDYKFDGQYKGIWNNPINTLKILKHFKGIITPDFSTYQDFPYPIKLYNTYRMRTFGFWAGRHGLEVVNNVRWGSKETFQYCFDGIEKNSVVAIGTVGGSPRRIIDRKRFENGLYKMVELLNPRTILIYGSASADCFSLLSSMGINIISYPSRTAKIFEGRKKHE